MYHRDAMGIPVNKDGTDLPRGIRVDIITCYHTSQLIAYDHATTLTYHLPGDEGIPERLLNLSYGRREAFYGTFEDFNEKMANGWM